MVPFGGKDVYKSLYIFIHFSGGDPISGLPLGGGIHCSREKINETLYFMHFCNVQENKNMTEASSCKFLKFKC